MTCLAFAGLSLTTAMRKSTTSQILNSRSFSIIYRPISLWTCGPIIPAAYMVFEQYGGCNIPEIRDGRIGKEIKACAFRKEDAEDIKRIVDVFSGYSASAMTALSMKQGAWKECRELGKKAIPEEDIQKYFRA